MLKAKVATWSVVRISVEVESSIALSDGQFKNTSHVDLTLIDFDQNAQLLGKDYEVTLSDK